MSKTRCGDFCEACNRKITSCPHLVAVYDANMVPCGCDLVERIYCSVPVVTVLRVTPPTTGGKFLFKADVYQCPKCLDTWKVFDNRQVVYQKAS